MTAVAAETGLFSVESSLFRWFQDNVTSPLTGSFLASVEFAYKFRRPIQVADYAGAAVAGKVLIAMNLIGIPQGAASDINDALAYDDLTPYEGRIASQFLEIRIGCHQQVTDDAEARIKIVRDALHHRFMRSGRIDPATGTITVPALRIYDYHAGPVGAPLETNNFIWRDRSSGALVESWIPDDEHPEVREWRMLYRVSWPEFWIA